MKKFITSAILSFAFLVGGLASVNGATLTVTKVTDTNDNVCDADCSLREAVFAASASGDVIEFASPLFDSAQNIRLSAALFQLNNNKTLTINGRAANLTAIVGSGAEQRVFFSNGNLTLNNLTITGGSLSGGNSGGGIYNGGTLTINNCIISGNRIAGGLGLDKLGGGIYNDAGMTLIINDSIITGNSLSNANQRAQGGGIYNAGNLTITRSTIAGNTADAQHPAVANEGGGIFNKNTGTLVVEHSTFSGNYINKASFINSGGAIRNEGNSTINNSTFSGNVVSGNTRNFGGAITTVGTMDITNSTVTANTATAADGSGINRGAGTLRIVNTIISGNSDTFGIVGGFQYNLNNFISGNARLMPLGNYGGPTQTHALYSDSPVINAGNDCVLTANGCGTGNAVLTDDQRGNGFPRKNGISVDIGAFEFAWIVTNTNNSGNGSLRKAITDAAAGDTITFDRSFFNTPQTISGGVFDIFKSLTIIGPGATLLTLDGQNASRVLNIDNSSATLNLSGVRITRGNPGAGISAGCILIANGTLNADDIAVDFCSTSAVGGGIYNNGTLILNNSTVDGNTAANAAGIYNECGHTATIINSIISNNISIGGSGGIGSCGTLNFYDSTLSGNTASFGGGLSNGGFANLANSTISGNRATNNKGAGIYNSNSATVHLLNTTVTNNRADGFAAAGIWNENSTSTTVRARNTIIAGNISGNGNPVDYTGGITDLGNNLINNNNPGLAPLGNYGGATPTHALLPNSPALNAGDNCALTANTCGIIHSALTNDQRGTNAPRKIGANIDIGAFERNISFNQTSFPNGSQNVSYSQQLSVARLTNFSGFIAENQLAPFTYSIIAGTLPPGLSLDANTGIISGEPTAQGIYNFTVKATDTDGIAGAAQYTIQVFAPTAAIVSVGGRILTVNGNGIRNVIVTLTDTNGNTLTTRTGTFGYFRFNEIEVGETYLISVSAKQFTFNPASQILTVNEELTDLTFIANE